MAPQESNENSIVPRNSIRQEAPTIDDELLRRVFDEDLRSHDRRFRLLELKFLLSFGLFGVEAFRIASGDTSSCLFLILPLVPILIDFANAAESYNLRRNQAFLREDGSTKVKSYVEYIIEKRNPIYGKVNIALTVSISVAAMLLFNLSHPDRRYNLIYAGILVPSVLFYWYLNRRVQGLCEVHGSCEKRRQIPVAQS